MLCLVTGQSQDSSVTRQASAQTLCILQHAYGIPYQHSKLKSHLYSVFNKSHSSPIYGTQNKICMSLNGEKKYQKFFGISIPLLKMTKPFVIRLMTG